MFWVNTTKLSLSALAQRSLLISVRALVDNLDMAPEKIFEKWALPGSGDP